LHLEKILSTKPYVYLVQEANVIEAETVQLEAQASALGYHVTFSQPTPLASGGISRIGRRLAILVRLPGVPDHIATLEDKSCAYLMHSGRWVEVFVPTADGSKHFGAANLYGHAGASTDGQLRRFNEILLKYAIARMSSFNDIPYDLGMDLNMVPETSENITTGRKEGQIYDVIPDWTHEDYLPLGTYRSGGVDSYMEILKGNGVTRIDTVLANTVAAHAVVGIAYCYLCHAGVVASGWPESSAMGAGIA
jgi:hypothetical protein